MHKNRQWWKFKLWIVCASALFLGAKAAPANLGSLASGVVSDVGVDRDAQQWIGTWATAAQPFLPKTLRTYRNQSLRLIVHMSAGGTKARIKLSNTYGNDDLLIGAAHIARRTAGAEIDPRSDRLLRFHGKSSTKIRAGSVAVSDPIELDVPALSDLAISLFLPGPTEARTSHSLAKQTSYVGQRGDLGCLASLLDGPYKFQQVGVDFIRVRSGEAVRPLVPLFPSGASVCYAVQKCICKMR